MTAALHTVHLRINEAATGQPTPVRLRLTDRAGTYYAPLGRLAEFALGAGQDVGGNVLLDGQRWAVIDGQCEVRLPAGPLQIEIRKGPEYPALQRELLLGVGQLAVRLTLERWCDLRAEGWYAGDPHAEFLAPHAALLEAAAEELNVVNLLARSYRLHAAEVPALSNVLAFSGQHPALERPGHLVVVNTLNHHPVLGSLALLNCHRPVYPLSFGGYDGPDDWSLANWCDQCHRKGGLVIGTNLWQEGVFRPGEVLADLLLGKVDALEIVPTVAAPMAALEDWYGLLNAGLRVPLVGGSGKASNRTVLGELRTYARIQPAETFTYTRWIEAVRAGRVLLTNGPLLLFTVNRTGPGGALTLPAEGSRVQVHAEARSAIPFQHLEVVANGRVIAQAQPSGSPAAAALNLELPWTESGWLAARCRGEAFRSAFAHSGPVYVEVKNRPQPRDEGTVTRLHSHLAEGLGWVQREGRFENDSQRQVLLEIFAQAQATLAERR